jgi:ABC-type glycerol-3-phosphate transport system substrate-binding protein
MRKLSFGLTLVLVMALLLAACGGGAPAAAPAEGGATDAGAAADVSAPAAEPTPVVNNFGQCSDPLILWHGLTGSDGAVFAELLQQFVDANPDLCLNSE